MQTNENHIINLVNQIISDAKSRNASDIHFEPYADNYRIRFRIDGLLHEIINLNPAYLNQVTTRLKVMAKLDIAERRLPQDGRFNFINDNKLNFDCRISTCPTLHGEKIVIRILNPNNSLLKINELGLEEFQLNKILETLKRPQGIILITGPTGSGKTNTLYAILNELNTTSRNIATVEDPIEINLSGVNQVNINSKINFDFAVALRTFLRQDPDIIMVGEIRDLETAEIAVKAAQTGHLVLATLHTNNAAESITRLLNMGITTLNLSNSLTLIIAERLVRILCPICKTPQQIPTEILLEEGFSLSELTNINPFSAVGCSKCNNGYLSRIGIFEVLPISENINHLLIQHKDACTIFATACTEGMLSLRKAGLSKVKQGITSLAEINRVT